MLCCLLLFVRGLCIYICEYAGSSIEVKTKANRNDVILYPHPRPYLCTECHKMFTGTSKCSLKTHNKIHNGENLFSCTECVKTFYVSERLAAPYEYS